MMYHRYRRQFRIRRAGDGCGITTPDRVSFRGIAFEAQQLIQIFVVQRYFFLSIFFDIFPYILRCTIIKSNENRAFYAKIITK